MSAEREALGAWVDRGEQRVSPMLLAKIKAVQEVATEYMGLPGAGYRNLYADLKTLDVLEQLDEDGRLKGTVEEAFTALVAAGETPSADDDDNYAWQGIVDAVTDAVEGLDLLQDADEEAV